jgi:hypothetical protein
MKIHCTLLVSLLGVMLCSGGQAYRLVLVYHDHTRTQFCVCHVPQLHNTSMDRTHSWDTQNAFSEKLSPHGFNLFLMLVVDLLHEFELGVWKAIFIHLIRILIAAGGETISRMNSR